jgi:hypothetical protein
MDTMSLTRKALIIIMTGTPKTILNFLEVIVVANGIVVKL